MSGKEVKEILQKSGYSLSYVAEMMGIIPQTLQSYLNVADIKTGVLEKIAASINKTVYFFYHSVCAENCNGEQKNDELLSAKDKIIAILEAQIADKVEIIAILKAENNNLKKGSVQENRDAGCAVAV